MFSYVGPSEFSVIHHVHSGPWNGSAVEVVHHIKGEEQAVANPPGIRLAAAVCCYGKITEKLKGSPPQERTCSPLQIAFYGSTPCLRLQTLILLWPTGVFDQHDKCSCKNPGGFDWVPKWSCCWGKAWENDKPLEFHWSRGIPHATCGHIWFVTCHEVLLLKSYDICFYSIDRLV